jgi:hypothetical protein
MNMDLDDDKSDKSYMMNTGKQAKLQEMLDDDLSVDIKSRS